MIPARHELLPNKVVVYIVSPLLNISLPMSTQEFHWALHTVFLTSYVEW